MNEAAIDASDLANMEALNQESTDAADLANIEALKDESPAKKRRSILNTKSPKIKESPSEIAWRGPVPPKEGDARAQSDTKVESVKQDEVDNANIQALQAEALPPKPTRKRRSILTPKKPASERTPADDADRANIALQENELTRNDEISRARELIENSESTIFTTLDDGRIVEARVLDSEHIEDGKVAIVYRENGRVQLKEQDVAELLKNQEKSLNREGFGPDLLERGEKAIEAMESYAPKVFDTVTKNKWLMASKLGKFATSALGHVGDGGLVRGLGALVQAGKEVPPVLWGMPKSLQKHMEGMDFKRTSEEAKNMEIDSLGYDALHELYDKDENDLDAVLTDSFFKSGDKMNRERKGAAEATSIMTREVLKSLGRNVVRDMFKGYLDTLVHFQEVVLPPSEDTEEDLTTTGNEDTSTETTAAAQPAEVVNSQLIETSKEAEIVLKEAEVEVKAAIEELDAARLAALAEIAAAGDVLQHVFEKTHEAHLEPGTLEVSAVADILPESEKIDLTDVAVSDNRGNRDRQEIAKMAGELARLRAAQVDGSANNREAILKLTKEIRKKEKAMADRAKTLAKFLKDYRGAKEATEELNALPPLETAAPEKAVA